MTMKLFGAKKVSDVPTGAPGEIIAADAKRGLIVSCADADVKLTTIQMPGAKRMNAADYLRGHSIDTGICLGKA